MILEARECFFRRLGRLLEERGWRGKVLGSWVFHSLGEYFWGGDFSYIFLQGKCTKGARRRIGLIQKQWSQKKKAKNNMFLHLVRVKGSGGVGEGKF